MSHLRWTSVVAGLLLLGAGCASAPQASAPLATPPAEEKKVEAPASQQTEEEKQDVQKMLEVMKKNPKPDPKLSAKPVAADQKFNGALEKSGRFERINYMTAGGALLMQNGERYYVVFDETFTTPNGPDLQIYLTKNSAPTTRADIMDGGLLLGKLKSTTGKQVYEIPTDANFTDYNSVTIHCKAFNVPWSFAPLK